MSRNLSALAVLGPGQLGSWLRQFCLAYDVSDGNNLNLQISFHSQWSKFQLRKYLLNKNTDYSVFIFLIERLLNLILSTQASYGHATIRTNRVTMVLTVRYWH